MSKLKMLKFEAATLGNCSEDIISQIQRIGVAQLEKREDARLSAADNADSVALYEKSGETVAAAMELLRDYGADFGGGMFSGRAVLDSKQFIELSKDVQAVIDDSHEVLRLKKYISDLESEKVRNTTLYDSLTVWKGIDIPLAGLSTSATTFFVGSFPRRYTYESLSLVFSESLPEIKEYSLKVLYSSDEITSCVVVCHKDVSSTVGAFLRSLSFAAPSDTECDDVIERLSELEKANSMIDEQICTSKEKLSSFAKQSEQFKFALDYCTVKRDEYLALSDVQYSDKTVYLTGYIPEKMAYKLSKVIDKSGGVVIYSEPDEDD
ncbi:MAG: hypothetical protein IJZ20_00385, partial [Clostridia bacterium]|nr:hypothetical protein [Clostridia bacterium]